MAHITAPVIKSGWAPPAFESTPVAHITTAVACIQTLWPIYTHAITAPVAHIKPLWLIREEQRVKTDLREQLAANELVGNTLVFSFAGSRSLLGANELVGNTLFFFVRSSLLPHKPVALVCPLLCIVAP